jgi:hypothetical protein
MLHERTRALRAYAPTDELDNTRGATGQEQRRMALDVMLLHAHFGVPLVQAAGDTPRAEMPTRCDRRK